MSSWEPCPAKHHLIMVYIFLRLFPLVQYLVCTYSSAAFKRNEDSISNGIKRFWSGFFFHWITLKRPQEPSEPLGEDFSPCIISKISDTVHPNHVTVAQLKFPATFKIYIYACVSDFIDVSEKIAGIALSNFSFCTG